MRLIHDQEHVYLTFDVYQKTSRRYGAAKRLAVDIWDKGLILRITHLEAGAVALIVQSDWASLRGMDSTWTWNADGDFRTPQRTWSDND